MAKDRKQDEINLRNFQNRIVEEDDFNNNRVPLGGEALGRYIQNLNAPEMDYQQPVNLVEQIPGQGNISYAQDSPNYANYGAIDPQIQFEIEETERQALEEQRVNQMISTIPVVEDEDKADMVKEVEKTPEIQALPRSQRKQVATQAVEESLAQSAAQSAEQAVQQTVELEAQDASPGSLKSKWLDAVKYFSPQLIGMAVGGVLGGRRGAIAGYEEGKGIRKGLDDMGIEFQKLNQQAVKQQMGMMQVSANTDLYDTQTGNIVQTNKMGQFISNGQVIPPERVGNLKVDREARTTNYQQQKLGIDQARLGISAQSLSLRERNAQRMAEHRQWLRDEADELSPVDVRALNAYEQTIQQAGAIAEAFKETNTGPISGRVQSLLEPWGLAPKSYTELRSQGGRMLADWMRSISGTAISENEAKRLEKLLPTANDPEKVFATKLVKFAEETERAMNIFKSGFKKQKGQGTSDLSDSKRSSLEQWAKNNPNDPRAEAVLKKLGGR